MKPHLGIKILSRGNWIMVPLRLFLGVTFVYAGLQKLTDPQYFNPAARGYIGRQIAGFANGSPLHDFLLNIAVPHATFFGALVAYGELAIGLGTLVGLLLRPAALFGLLTNLIFFLSADWRVFPYFYGSDLIFAIGWLTLLLAGPANQALPALDSWLVTRLLARASRQPRWAAFCAFVLGIKVAPVSSPIPQPIQPQLAANAKGWQPAPTNQQGRRTFLWGTLSGGVAMLALAWLAETLHLLPNNASNPNALAAPTLGSPVPTSTPTPSNPGPGGTIAKISDVPINNSVSFTLPSSDPGVLIHLNNGQFVAYNATCTHAGCLVDFDSDSRQLICPCHGATFDPTRSAAVRSGPAQTPLASVPITVNQSAGTIALGQ